MLTSPTYTFALLKCAAVHEKAFDIRDSLGANVNLCRVYLNAGKTIQNEQLRKIAGSIPQMSINHALLWAKMKNALGLFAVDRVREASDNMLSEHQATVMIAHFRRSVYINMKGENCYYGNFRKTRKV